MPRQGGTIFTVSGLVLLAYLWLRQRCPPCPAPRAPVEQLELIKRLQKENAELRKQLLAAKQTACPSAAAMQSGLVAALPAAAAPPPPAPGKRQWWYWTDLVMDSLRPFDKLNGGITLKGLRLAEQKCKVSTWCHRAQVIDGRLYITDLRAIFFDR